MSSGHKIRKDMVGKTRNGVVAIMSYSLGEYIMVDTGLWQFMS